MLSGYGFPRHKGGPMFAAGIVALAVAVLPTGVGLGVGLMVAAAPVFGLSFWAAR